MNDPLSLVPWLTNGRDEWLNEVAKWIAERLGVGVEPSSLDAVKLRPWAAVLRAETASGHVIFKAVGPQCRHETTLLADMAGRQTHLAPAVLSVDHARGWLLMPNHGEPIVDQGLQRQVAFIEQLLPQYAELQQTTAGLVDRWLAAGVPDRRPQLLPDLLERLLAGSGRTGPLPIEADEIHRLAEGLDAFAQVCDVLTDGPVGGGIDHADIHGTNILLGEMGLRLIDWGDSCIGHPFSSLLVPMEWVAGRLGRYERSRAVARMVDAYIEPWGRQGDRAVLGYAIWAGYVARALSNDEQCAGGSSGDIADARDEIVALLRTWREKHAFVDRPQRLLVPAMPW